MADNDLLQQCEDSASFYERQLTNRRDPKGFLSTTVILGSVIILLVKVLIANTRELKRKNDSERDRYLGGQDNGKNC